jgi:putative Holliday junction resolvase
VIVKTPAELADSLKAGERLLGLDLGEKTIGLALSDVMRMIATPLVTLERTKFSADAQALITVIDKNAVGGLVIGLPLNMNGTEGPSAQFRGQAPDADAVLGRAPVDHRRHPHPAGC